MAWAKAGLVDVVVPAPFLDADFDIPIELWREQIGPSRKVALAPCLESDCRGDPELGPHATRWVHNRVEMVRGFTAAMLHRGADRVYLFNFLEGGWPNPEYRAILNECGRLETVVDKPRRHIVTSHDTVPPGVSRPPVLPQALVSGRPLTFRLYTGPRPMAGRALIRALFANQEDEPFAQIAAHVNSVACRRLADLAKLEPFAETVRVAQFDVPLASLREGSNQITLSAQTGASQKLLWLEMFLDPARH